MNSQFGVRAAVFAVILIALTQPVFAQHAERVTGKGKAFSFSRDPQALVLSYTFEVRGVADEDIGPTVQIYGDGRMLVHYPDYMVRAGDYELQLSEGELADVLSSLVDEGAADIDISEAKARKRQRDIEKRQNEGTLHYVSDRSVSVIDVHLEDYAPTAAAASANQASGQKNKIDKTIRWEGLEADARHYTDDQGIQGLARAEQVINNLMKRSDLVKKPKKPKKPKKEQEKVQRGVELQVDWN